MIKRLLLMSAVLLCAATSWAAQTVRVVPAEGGTVAASDPVAGQTVTLTVTPDAGYSIALADITVEVTISGDLADAPRRVAVGQKLTVAGPDKATAAAEYTFTMPEEPYNVKVTTVFNQEEYTVTVDDSIANGTVSATPNTGLHYGDTVTLTITPDNEYELETLTVTDADGNPVTVDMNDYTFTMPASDVTVTATFVTTAVLYNIYVTTDDNGTVTAPATAIEGATVTLTVTPNEGYKVDEVTVYDADGGVVTLNDDYTFIMPAMDVRVVASFKQIVLYTVTIDDAIVGGTVTASPEQAEEGDTVTLTATAQDGYEFVGMTVTTEGGDEVTLNDDNTFAMPAANVTVTATFEAVTGCTLAEALELEEGATVRITEDLVVAISLYDGVTILTDNQHHWIQTTLDDEAMQALQGVKSLKGSTIKGVVSQLDTNPIITLSQTPEEGDLTDDPVLEEIDMTHYMDVPGSSLGTVAGYYNAGVLRAYFDTSLPGQMVTINNHYVGDALDTQTNINLNLTVIVNIKQAWETDDNTDPTPAPARIKKDDRNSSTNYIFIPISADRIVVTGVNDLNADQPVSVTYVNVAGQTAATPFDGVNIVVTRHADGSTSTAKLVK